MRRIPKIGLWYIAFMLIPISCIAFMPARSQPPTKIIIVGDSFADLATWPVTKRICYSGAKVTQIIEMVQRQDIDISITDILILVGVASHFYRNESLSKTEEDISVLESVLIQKYPNANINKVSINEMVQCAKEYPRSEGDGHLSPMGYEMLRQRHFSHLTF